MGKFTTDQVFGNRKARVGAAVIISYGPPNGPGVPHAGIIAAIVEDTPVIHDLAANPSMVLASRMIFRPANTQSEVEAMPGSSWTWPEVLVGA